MRGSERRKTAETTVKSANNLSVNCYAMEFLPARAFSLCNEDGHFGNDLLECLGLRKRGFRPLKH